VPQLKLVVKQEYKSYIPRPSKEDYEGLKQSIKEKGYFPEYPIITNSKHEILDGYTRYQICEELGIEPKFVIKEFDNEFQELEYILLVNRRRNLTEDQRVILARKWQELKSKEAMQNRIPERD